MKHGQAALIYVVHFLIENAFIVIVASYVFSIIHICVVDFSKAFDLINRTIVFYKLINSGWTGRAIDMFRSLYRNTHFRVKRNGKSSPPRLNNIGVNQGGPQWADV